MRSVYLFLTFPEKAFGFSLLSRSPHCLQESPIRGSGATPFSLQSTLHAAYSCHFFNTPSPRRPMLSPSPSIPSSPSANPPPHFSIGCPRSSTPTSTLAMSLHCSARSARISCLKLRIAVVLESMASCKRSYSAARPQPGLSCNTLAGPRPAGSPGSIRAECT